MGARFVCFILEHNFFLSFLYYKLNNQVIHCSFITYEGNLGRHQVLQRPTTVSACMQTEDAESESSQDVLDRVSFQLTNKGPFTLVVSVLCEHNLRVLLSVFC